MHNAHRSEGDDGPTLLFQRNLPGHGERCTICPFNRNPISTAPPRPAITAHPPSRRSNPTLVAPANAPPATLPRPALLTADLRGSGTLVLPDALRSAGPDAATIEQAQAPGPHPLDTRRHPVTGKAARDPDFDELASPDITVLQPALAPAIRPVRVRARRPARLVSARAYLALNLCLGLLIVAGLVLLVIRDVPSATPIASASE